MFKVSIVIPTYRKPQRLALLLNSLEESSFEKSEYEILIIGNLSCSRSQRLAETYQNRGLPIKYWETGSVGVNVARNHGLLKAQGKICCFLDDDCILPDKDWLTRLFSKFQSNPDIIGCGGYYDLSNNSNFWGVIYYIKLKSWLLYFQSPDRQAFRLLGGCMSFRREALCGLRFNENIRFGGAETDFIHQLTARNYLLKIDPDLSIEHDFRVSFLEFVRKAMKQGQYHLRSTHISESSIFQPKTSFKDVQREVIDALGASFWRKNLIHFGIWIHKISFYTLAAIANKHPSVVPRSW